MPFKLSYECKPFLYFLRIAEEDGPGASRFLSEFGSGTHLRKHEAINMDLHRPQPALYHVLEVSGTMVFEQIEAVKRESLSSDGVFLLDLSLHSPLPCIFVWIGSRASSTQARLSLQYGQRYLHDKKIKTETDAIHVAIPIIKIHEGDEPAEFLEVL